MILKERYYNFDLLRIICAFFVVLIHVNAQFLSPRIGVGETQGLVLSIEQLINIITRFSVPCFVMLSGAFLLDNSKNREFNFFYKKSFKNIVFPFLLISAGWLLYFFVEMVIQLHNYREYIKLILTVGYGSFWYIPMIIILYLCVPILIRIKESLSEKQFAIMGVILLLWGIISQATTSYQIPYASGIVVSFMGFFVIGDCIKNSNAKARMPGGGQNLILIILLIVVTWRYRMSGFAYYQFDAYRAFFSPTIVVYSILVFIFFKNLNLKRDYSKLAKYMYYVYLLHTIFLAVIKSKLGMDWFQNEIISIFVITIVTFLCSIICAIIIKPIFDKLGHSIFNLNNVEGVKT